VFADSVSRVSHEAAPGDIAILYGPKGKLAGVGLYDPNSPIRIRVFQFGKGAPIGPELFSTRVRAAAKLREDLLCSPETDGFRLLYGPNDGMPGAVVDIYAGTAVLKLYTQAWLPWMRELCEAIGESFTWERLVLRLARGPAERFGEYGLRDGQILDGPPLDGPVVFRENGIRFEAEPVSGQKTGFFLDQRDNRARVEAISRGHDVLNVFSYTGGFSVYAARGGARRVVSVDISKPASAAAERNFAMNDGQPSVHACEHDAIAQDAFEAMRTLADAGERFGVVIVDPPSFAKRASEIDGALRAYQRLARLAARLVRPDGVLVLASCSSRITIEPFRAAVLSAVRESLPKARVRQTTEHPSDHPVAFDGSAYLKCVFIDPSGGPRDQSA
jgi:23S rRNA (cytosine1962-C5)-methyltransferase